MNSVNLDIDRATHLILAKQHLTTNAKSADIVQVVRDVGGLHATLGTTPYLSLFARSTQFKKPDLDIVNLLPILDPYLMGYKERARYLNEADQNYVFDRSGNATSTILVNGKIVGVWDLEQRSRDATEPVVKLFFFRDVSPRVMDQIRTQARDLGHFIAASEVRVRACNTMVRLPLRPAGHMMTPLKGVSSTTARSLLFRKNESANRFPGPLVQLPRLC